MDEIFTENKELSKIYRVTFRGGRRLMAFVFDSLFFGAAALAALYLTVRPGFKNRPAALFITSVCGLIVFFVLRVADRERFRAHKRKLRAEAKDAVLRRKALLSSEELFRDIPKDLCFPSAEALTADDVKQAGPIIVTLAEPTETAKRLLGKRRIVTPFEYFSKEPSELIPVSEAEIDAELIRSHERILKKPSFPRGLKWLSSNRALKYFAVGAALFAMSFFAKYSLYFRIISSVSLTLGAYVFAAGELKRLTR